MLNGYNETLDTMSVQIKLDSLDGNNKLKIDAYKVIRVTKNMRVIDWRPLVI